MADNKVLLQGVPGLPLDSAKSRDNSTGFTIQWGQRDRSDGSVNYPRGFTSCLGVLVSKKLGSATDAAIVYITGWNNAGFFPVGAYYPNTNNPAVPFCWLAFGFT